MEMSTILLGKDTTRQDSKVYVRVSPYLWGRTRKLQIIIREDRYKGFESEYESMGQALEDMKSKYQHEYLPEDFFIVHLVDKGYRLIPFDQYC
ncbi:hypothetical protein BCE02nite_46550 [Brevibacillus centrosporus]|nr:hypothetical protein BCE02nite_46550 [Brevibacillus centrosporus]